MFTVKVITENGNEQVLDAHSVLATASERLTSDSPYAIESVWFQTSEGAEIEISGEGATVYVMNDKGATVSKYSLGVNNGIATAGA
jgi:hypothetical protein